MDKITLIAVDAPQTVVFDTGRPPLELPGGRAVDLDPLAEEEPPPIYIPPPLRPTVELPAEGIGLAMRTLVERAAALAPDGPLAFALTTDGTVRASTLQALRETADRFGRSAVVIARTGTPGRTAAALAGVDRGH